jgi:hypothetical protein
MNTSFYQKPEKISTEYATGYVYQIFTQVGAGVVIFTSASLLKKFLFFQTITSLLFLLLVRAYE